MLRELPETKTAKPLKRSIKKLKGFGQPSKMGFGGVWAKPPAWASPGEARDGVYSLQFCGWENPAGLAHDSSAVEQLLDQIHIIK